MIPWMRTGTRTQGVIAKSLRRKHNEIDNIATEAMAIASLRESTYP